MEYKRVKLKNLHPNPYPLHEALAGSLIARIKAFKKILHGVDPGSIEKTIGDFLRDVHPGPAGAFEQEYTVLTERPVFSTRYTSSNQASRSAKSTAREARNPLISR